MSCCMANRVEPRQTGHVYFMISKLCKRYESTFYEVQVRLLMCYSATHLEKLDITRQQQWQKVARLGQDDMAMVTNLEYLGVPVRKRNKGGVITFGRKRRRAVRKDREADEDDQQFALSRFVPMLQEVLEDASTGLI